MLGHGNATLTRHAQVARALTASRITGSLTIAALIGRNLRDLESPNNDAPTDDAAA